MKILLTFNPVAGKGLGAASARAIRDHIHGHQLQDGRVVEVESLETRLGCVTDWLSPNLEGVDLLVAIGGDGAVGMVAPAAVEAAIPIYHYPTGTENLFSRDHGMLADPVHLLDTIERGQRLKADVVEVEGELMLMCASIGFDAEVVHDLATHRSGPISHLSYLGPILRSLFRWKRVRSHVSVSVDGGEFANLGHGLLVLANSSQYAMRLDPARAASPTSGVLEVVFLPVTARFHLLIWALRCRFGTHLSHPKAVFTRGRTICVRCQPGALVQIDGDAFKLGTLHETVQARILGRSLHVLAPSSEKPSN